MPHRTPKLHNPHLDYLNTHWGALKGSLTPGTRRPTRALDPWVQLEPPGPGHAPAPLHIDTFDLLLDIQADVHGWLEEVGTLPLGRMPAPIAQLDAVLHHSRRRAGTWAADVTEWARIQADRVRDRLEGGIDGQTLASACPICGAHGSLRIRVMRISTGAEPYLACESGTCTPPEGYCANFLGPTPVWPMAEWEWFATLLQAQERGQKREKK